MARVKEVLADSAQGLCRTYLSLINLGEVLYIIERKASAQRAVKALGAIEQLPIHVLPVSRAAVLAAAHVKALYFLSYADAFAVAAAMELGAAIVTGDPEFQAVEGIARVEWLSKA